MEKHKTSGHAAINGISMYYEIHGEGAMPLVLIHGGGSTIQTTWGNILPLFSAHRKVIAVELQAHGRTTDRDAPESFEQDANDVITLLQYLKIDKADFSGFSNGGTTVLHIAVKYPAIVNKIIVISANYKKEGLIPGFFNGFEQTTLDQMPELLRNGFLDVTPDKDKLQAMFEKDKQRMLSFKDMADEDLRAIKAPALLMLADRDVITPEHVIKMAQLIPGARLAILPGYHGTFIGEVCSIKNGSRLPEMTAGLIEEFLND